MSDIRFGDVNFFVYENFFISHRYYAPSEEPHANTSHMHNTAEFMVVEQGNATVRIENEFYRTSERYLVYFPARSVHFCVNNPGFAYARYCLSMHESYFVSEVELPKSGFVIQLKEEQLSDLLAPTEQLYRYFSHFTGAYTLHMLQRRDCLLRWFLAEVHHLLSCTDNEHLKLRKNYIGEVCDYMEQNLSSSPTLEELADHFFICKSKLTRDFREIMGVSVGQYMDSIRISRARQMLCEGALVSDTAQLCGFSSSASFIRFFRQKVGVTPSQYRKH